MAAPMTHAATYDRDTLLVYGRFAALAAIAVAGLALRLRLAWESIDKIVLKSTPDDAYYYFQIARNVAHGRNVTFDGETVTNGFHPLWLVLITPVYGFVDGDAMPVHVILTIGAILGTGTAVLAYAVVARLTANGVAGVFAAAFYALHPATVADSVNGVESALVVFMFALAVLLFLDSEARRGAPSLARSATFGAVSGLTVLARTDLIFVVPPMIGYLVLCSEGADRRERALIMVAAFAATLVPWCIWTLAANGTVVQISGLAGAYPERYAYLAEHGDSWSGQIGHGVGLVREALFDNLIRQYFVQRDASVAPLVVAAAIVTTLMATVPFGEARPSAQHRLILIGVVSSGVIAALLYHAGLRWHVRGWYFAPTAFLAALWLGLAVDYGSRAAAAAVSRMRDRTGNVASALARAAVYAAVAIVLIRVYNPLNPQRWLFFPAVQSNLLESARWLDTNTSPDARIGSPNAGIIGYFSHRTVVNLDGVVNADAFYAIKECRSAQYVREKRLDYLADLPRALGLANCGEPHLHLTLIATIGQRLTYFDGGQITVVRIDR